MIIGLNGFARSGKDEVAKILVRDHGFKQVAFADKLRESLYALNPIIAISEPRHCSETIHDKMEPISTTIYLQQIIDRVGWDGYKETKAGPEIRRLLQRLGTEAGRQTLGENIWVDATLKDYTSYENWVVSDARFLNEFDAITQRGGDIWRIERPGVEALNDHASETEALQYNNFAYTLFNAGTLEDLAYSVRGLV